MMMQQEYRLKQKTRVRVIAVILAFALFFPLLFTNLAYADTRYWCDICGAELSISGTNEYNDTILAHPDNGCDVQGEDFVDYASQNGSLSTSPYVTTKDPSTGEETDPDKSVIDEPSSVEGSDTAFGEDFIRMMLDTIFNTDSANEGSFMAPANLLDKTFEYLCGENGVIDVITDSTWYLFLVGACFIIMLFRFMSDYAMEKVWDVNKQTPEMLYKPLFKLVAAMVFVVALPHFLKLGLYLSQAAIHVIRDNPFSSDGADTSAILSSAQDSLIEKLGFEAGGLTKLPQNLGALIQGVLVLILPYIISMVCNVGIFFACFSRILELAIRAALAPLSMTDIYKAGDRSHGIHYLFEFFGVCFQGFAILLVFFVADYISALVIREMLAEFEGFTGTIQGIAKITMCVSAINLSKLVLVLKTASLAKGALSGG